VTAHGSAYSASIEPWSGNVTEALSAAAELEFVGLAEALELTLLVGRKEPAS
jgi:hypothetical protein